ncbi:MAG: DUF3089 domain-containing protein [Halioglobus sp.]
MKVIKVFGITTAVVILLAVVLTVTGWGGTLFFKAFIAFSKPPGDFNPAEAVAPPDYSLTASWASLPTMEDPADLVPDGVAVKPQGEHPVDVFFIHPTGFLTSGSWTSPMDRDSGTEENTRFMMANQASAFNGCCNIYAPRYREANIFAYFGSGEDRDALLGFAYQDVKRAFEHYLAHDNQGRPFVLAGHSQGTHHAQRLLAEVIDTTDLHQRMVAAYVIGSTLIPVSADWFSSMDHIAACESAEDLSCVVHWDTMPEGTPAYERPADSLCTNPLSWQVNETLAEASLNDGALPPVGTLNQAIGRVEDAPSHQILDSLAAPRSELTWAQCRGGTLYADNALGKGFEIDAMGTYHQADYALFYMNVHHNAKLRASRYLELREAP